MKKINIIFPMAGEGSRFGYQFKPFMRLGDQTFIEHAIEPFYEWSNYIDKVYFIFREDQEINFNVSEYLRKNITLDQEKIIPVIIPHKTKGPLETIRYALDKHDIQSGIVCDCDHKININNLFEKIIETYYNKTIIPVWKIVSEESKNWSKIVLHDTKIIDIVEKEDVDFNLYNVWGILGCIYFSDLSFFKKTKGIYVSDVCRNILNSDNNLSFCPITDAYFFGDPDMLEKCLEQRRRQCSIFFDIDGVLLKHHDHSSNDVNKNTPLKDNIELLKKLKAQDHKIILTTARSSKYKSGLKKLLKDMSIPYDEIITGLASGPRILINDRKTSKPFTTQANSCENYRNESILLNIEQILHKNDEKIIKDMSANSGAKTFLIQKDKNLFVRKIVRKNINDFEKHIDILKRQKNTLENLNIFKPDLCPKILNTVENNLEYYIDMEYLKDYQKLSDFDVEIKEHVLEKLMKDLKKNVYAYSKQLTEKESEEFFKNFIDEKISKKLNNFALQSDRMKSLILSDNLYINNKKYKSLKQIFNSLEVKNYAPTSISPVHGDLTLENILYNVILDDYKLIDMDGAKLMDTYYLDLGKLSQSIIACYNEWNNANIEIEYRDDKFICNNDWFSMTAENKLFLKNIWPFEEDSLIDKAIFYMSTYFIRFVSFRLKKGINHGIFALIMAVVWLNKLEKLNE